MSHSKVSSLTILDLPLFPYKAENLWFLQITMNKMESVAIIFGTVASVRVFLLRCKLQRFRCFFNLIFIDLALWLCHVPCRVLVPQPGIKLTPPALQVLTRRPPRKSQGVDFLYAYLSTFIVQESAVLYKCQFMK